MYEGCKIRHKQMTSELYPSVREFIIKHYNSFEETPNWLIDRLEFTYTVSKLMSGTDNQYFEEHNRLWYADDELIAVVNTEGELGGEAFFQTSTFDYPKSLLCEMFEFVEEKLMLEIDGEVQVKLRLNNNFEAAITMAKERGYAQGDWEEVLTGLDLIEEREVKLPEGYEIVTRKLITSEQRAMAHQQSFGYEADDELTRNCVVGFDAMMLQPDYRDDLDLFVLNPEKEVAAFANVWLDHKNHIGIFEPVGTVKSEVRKGLGRAILHEGMNRALKLGANKMYVGSDQEFYKSLGFVPDAVDLVFIKKD